jgi:hypothetical protein
MLLVWKGQTIHLPLHYDDNDDRQRDTTEIPPTEILDRIFTVTVTLTKN